MLEEIGRAAEKAAAGVPRRHFLGRLARGAALVAGSLGGILLTAGPAGAKGGGGPWCCVWSADGGYSIHCSTGRCTKDMQRLWRAQTVRCSDHWACSLEP